MMRHGFLALALMLPGCATVGELERDERPNLAYETSKSPQDVATCISENWSERSVEFSTQIRGEGYAMPVRGQWTTIAAAFIEKTAGGSSVRYTRLATVPDFLMNDVASCR